MQFTNPKNPMLKVSLASLIAVSSLALVSCQDEDYGFTKDEVRAAVYDRNFIAHYGEIAKDQSWDLSKYAVDNSSATRANVDQNTGIITCNFDNDPGSWLSGRVTRQSDWYYVDNDLVKKFTDELPEGANNTSKGDPFNMKFDGSFYVIPLFQGASGIESDLHMVVTLPDGKKYDKCIWDKSAFIQKQVSGSFNWNGLEAKFDHWRDYGGKGENGVYKGSTLYAKGVRTNPIKCEIPQGAIVSFYLHITKGHLNYATSAGEHDGYSLWNTTDVTESNLVFSGVKQSSSEGKMIALKSSIFTVDEATQKKYGSNITMVGCEDAMYGTEKADIYNYDGQSIASTYQIGQTYKDKNGTDREIIRNGEKKWEGDNDMNDIIFMIISHANQEIVKAQGAEKRYLVEDLGSVVDWDFNDIVVDFIQSFDNEGNESQKAILRHLCGTTPFELYVGPAGDYTTSKKLEFHKSGISYRDYLGNTKQISFNGSKLPGAQMHKDEMLDVECTVPDNAWDPATNNVWIKVFPGENDIINDNNVGNSQTNTMHTDGAEVAVISFPDRGQVPRIIATDIDFQWTTEDDNIEATMWSSITVTATSNNTTWGTVSGAGTYRVGKEVVLTAEPKTKEYEFVSWSDGNKEITRSFIASSDVSLSATFQHIETSNAVGSINGSGFFITDVEHLKSVIEAGYNTITVNATNVPSGAEFHLGQPSGSWPNLLDSDPLTYKFDGSGSTSGTVVLSKEQLAVIKNSGFVIQNINANTYTYNITGVTWSKTPDYFTINLAVNIDGVDNSNDSNKAKVTLSDRGTWNKSAAFGQSVFAVGEKVTLTAEPKSGYVFSHWLNKTGGDNIVKANPITIEANSNLVAYFRTAPDHNQIRTIWTGTEVGTNWEHQEDKILEDEFSPNDTYQNTLLRVYVEKTGGDFNLQLKSNDVLPPDANSYGNITTVPSGQYLDIMMSQDFFNAIKSTNKMKLTGKDIKVTKVQLVPFYNLMQNNPTKQWGDNVSVSNNVINFTGSGSAAGWPISSSLSNYNKAVFDYSKNNNNATVKVTYRFNENEDKFTQKFSEAKDKSVNLIYVESDSQCQVTINKAYLTKE